MSSENQILAAILCSAVALTAFAYTYPPYELYPYLAESTDTPPVNYMKVCEPGVTGESNATYVVLGVSFPRTYQAVNGDFTGDLVIPAYIDGLPVRKIKEDAFALCQGLTGVKIPHTVREIGARAFRDCWCLTNITFEAGVATIGDGVFSNCLSIASMTFPKSLSKIGSKCFQGCVSLTNVTFLGNAPRLSITGGEDEKSYFGESIYRNYGYYERFKINVDSGTYGWKAPYEKGVPEKWPVDYGYMQAHEVVAGVKGEDGAVPSGFVTVIIEIKGGAIAVPETWATAFPAYAAKFGSDFTASLTKPTGKTDASGNAMQVWQDYVAGTDPTDLTDKFSALITVTDGNPVISWTPVLPAAQAAKRKYTVYGRKSLLSGDWTQVAAGTERNYNFFKVTVEMVN